MRKSCDELKAEMEAIQQQMAEAKKNEHTQRSEAVCKEFDFTAGMLKCSISEGRKPKNGS